MIASDLLTFGSLVVERQPLDSRLWYIYLESFFQDGGGFALVGLMIWLIAALARSLGAQSGPKQGVPLLLAAAAMISLACFTVGGAGYFIAIIRASGDAETAAQVANAPIGFQVSPEGKWWNHAMTLGGVFSILGVFVPFLLDCRKLRVRRISALTKLSFTEAVRGRILWVFTIFLLLFLFPPKWFFPIKAENEISSSVELIYGGTTPLLLFAAGLLAAFSLPADIRNQTIHTIVTKPVERFEIVLGRYFGFLGLVSLVMFAVFGLALAVIVMSRVDPEARAESMKARDPVYGDLQFLGPTKNYQGDSVGREWEYRRYVAGGPASPFRAVWAYYDRDLSSGLADLPYVKCEFSFDIFRTHKGKENEAVYCTFFVIAHQAVRDQETLVKNYREKVRGLSAKARPDPDATDVERRDWKTLEEIAGSLGYFEFNAVPIADYHTQSIPIPASLVAKAMADSPPTQGGRAAPRLMIAVRCDSPSQYIGVAKPDLYLLAAEGNFYVNFFKGSLGLWLRLVVVIAIAVTCSTYLNGVVSFLATGFLTLLGFFRTFLILFILMPFTMQNANPGPADSFRKLLSNESLGTAPDQSNPAHQVASAMDESFRWGLRRVFNVVPNLERLDWEQYVAKGFNIPTQDLLWNFLFVMAYVGLWAVLAHYLIKWREVATW